MAEDVDRSFPHLIDERWMGSSGSEFFSRNPSNGDLLWRGRAADEATVGLAVSKAKTAFESWSDVSFEERERVLRRFATVLEGARAELGKIISLETGKPLRESTAEVMAMINKVDFSVRAYHQRCAEFSSSFHTAPTASCGSQSVLPQPTKVVTRFRAHGVLAVLGPFNFPGHLPNGHIVPALLAGNTVVFKPSEKTPWTAEYVMRLWVEAGLPAGVLNLVQGGADTARALAGHKDVRGVLFTGSAAVGQALHELCAPHPEKILALEMGGNNPLVIHEVSDIDAAVSITVQSGFSTTGQRCTCARRLIITNAVQREQFLEKLVETVRSLRIGPPDEDPEPFCGPLISEKATNEFLKKQAQLRQLGAKVLVEGRLLRAGTGFVSAAILNVTGVANLPDEECFGPLLQVTQVSDLDEAIAEANRTSYGLAAGIVTQKASDYERFRKHARAGIVNWNAPLVGASSAAPFGGIGLSGNYRPSAFFAADYCSYPMVSIECEEEVSRNTANPGRQQANATKDMNSR